MLKQKIYRMLVLVLAICMILGIHPAVFAASPVTITVNKTTKLTYNSVQLNASCKYTTKPSEVGVYLGTSSNSLTKKDYDKINHNKNPFSIWYNLPGLKEGTKYYYQFYANVRGRIYKSSICNFTTPKNTAAAPKLTVKNPTNLKSNSVRLNASCSYSTKPTEVGIYMGTSTGNLSKKDYDKINHNKNPFDIWYDLPGLQAGTTYYYQFYAVANNKEYKSGIYNFTTPQNVSEAPNLIVKNPTNLSSNSVQLNASCSYSVKPTEVGIYVGISHDNLSEKVYDKINLNINPFDIWYNLSGLQAGTTYYYQVYAVVNNKEYRSGVNKVTTLSQNSSASTAVNASQLVAKGENSSKCQLLFGDANKRRYGSQSEAAANMVSITVPVWKLSNGKKVSSSITFKIHRAIANDVQEIFKEIYNDPEQFPMHTIYGYSWRGDTAKGEHNCGTAIDINPTQNCQIRNGVIETGNLWNPWGNSYSIPENGSVVRIFEKHGWSWGGKDWAGHTDWRYDYHDYMHFSYMGG